MVTLLKEAIYSIYINPRHIFTNNHACPQHGKNHFKLFFKINLCYPMTGYMNFKLIQQKGGSIFFLTLSLRETKRTRAKDKLVIKDSSYFPSIKDIESVHFLSLILLPMTGFLQKCDVITLLLLRKQQLRKRTEHIPY